MNYTISDLSGYMLAILVSGALALLPILGIMRLAGQDAKATRGGLLLAATALMPALTNAVWTLLGRDVTLAMLGALTAIALTSRRLPDLLTLSRRGFALAATMALILAFAWIDIDWGGKLYMSSLVIDGVKHAATTRVLSEATTLPPADPFFLRSTPASYYYFYYLLPALVDRLGHGLIDARMSFAGTSLWTGFAFIALVRRLATVAGLSGQRLPDWLLYGLLLAGGMQIIPALLLAILTGEAILYVTWWSELVSSFLLSWTWVPHHLAALISVWVGLLAALETIGRLEKGVRDRSVALSLAITGTAFASLAGHSVWLAVAGVAAVGVWTLTLALERRWHAVATIAGAGLIALVLDIGYLGALRTGRDFGGLPIGFGLHAFPFTDHYLPDEPVRGLVRIAMLPLSYVIDFGVFFVGASYWWTTGRHLPASSTQQRDMRRLLVMTAATGLVIFSFIQSTVKFNDLGWRAVLLTQMSLLIWTFAAIQAVVSSPQIGAALRLGMSRAFALPAMGLALGFASNVYDIWSFRDWFSHHRMVPYASRTLDPAVDRDLRVAFEWLAAHAPDAVAQHAPDFFRTYAFGLYGRTPVAVSDRHSGSVFGASDREADERMDRLTPVFAGQPTPTGDVRHFAEFGVDFAIVTKFDGAWQKRDSWAWTAPSPLGLDTVRVVQVRARPGVGLARGDRQ